MFILIDPCRINPEKRIRQPTRQSRIAKIGMDDEDGEDREDDAVAQAMEAMEGVERPDDAVRIGVEEGDVLL